MRDKKGRMKKEDKGKYKSNRDYRNSRIKRSKIESNKNNNWNKKKNKEVMIKNRKAKKVEMIIKLDMILIWVKKIVLRKKMPLYHKKMRKISNKKHHLHRIKLFTQINKF